MASRCVNPACRREFKFFNTGDLYALERRSADSGFFWHCSACVPRVPLYLDPTGCVSVGPRCDAVRPPPPDLDRYLRLVAQRKATYTLAPRHPCPGADALKGIWTRSASFVERGRINLANIKTRADVSEREQNHANVHNRFSTFVQQGSSRH